MIINRFLPAIVAIALFGGLAEQSHAQSTEYLTLVGLERDVTNTYQSAQENLSAGIFYANFAVFAPNSFYSSQAQHYLDLAATQSNLLMHYGASLYNWAGYFDQMGVNIGLGNLQAFQQVGSTGIFEGQRIGGTANYWAGRLTRCIYCGIP